VSTRTFAQARDQFAGERGATFQEVFGVVEQHQHSPGRYVVAQRLRQRPALLLAHFESARDRLRNETRVPHCGQLDESDSVRVGEQQCGGYLKRQTRLPTAARARQREGLCRFEQPLNLLHLRLAANESGDRLREVVLWRGAHIRHAIDRQLEAIAGARDSGNRFGTEDLAQRRDLCLQRVSSTMTRGQTAASSSSFVTRWPARSTNTTSTRNARGPIATEAPPPADAVPSVAIQSCQSDSRLDPW